MAALPAAAQPAPEPPPAAGEAGAEGEVEAEAGASAEGAAAATVPLGAPLGDAPPEPPPPGQAPGGFAPPPAALPPGFAQEATASWRDGDDLPLAGWHGRFFLRDPDDYFRLYPSVRAQLDLHTWMGPRVHDLPVGQGGEAFDTKFVARRLWLGFDGEVLKRWSFRVRLDLGASQRIQNEVGTDQASAAPPGVEPTAATARYARVQTETSVARLNDVFINYSLCPCLNFMFGQALAPFGLSNQTGQPNLPMLERNVAIAGLAVPDTRDGGVLIWGEINNQMINYTFAMLSGDGQNRPGVDGSFDFSGRVWVRPFKSIAPIKNAHIGISAQHGQRDPERVGYDYPGIATGQGYALWSPGYRDSLGQRIHVVPSGAQNKIGGELRVPVWRLDVMGEAIYVANNTREAVEGFQLTNTERLGGVRGLGWYGSVTWWMLGDTFIAGDAGFQKPATVNLRKKIVQDRGLSLAGEIAHVTAEYAPADRGGVADVASPGQPGVASDLSILQYSGTLSYWHTRHVRIALGYSLYQTPGSGSVDNMALVPANLGSEPDNGSHVLHELTTRIALDL